MKVNWEIIAETDKAVKVYKIGWMPKKFLTISRINNPISFLSRSYVTNINQIGVKFLKPRNYGND